jgi:FixJ family two-component response regulator
MNMSANMPAEQIPVVYVVDDDTALREALSSLFRSVDLRVKTFATAAEFLQFPRPEEPSCLVLDVSMPGLSGPDFQSELNKASVHIPIVFMTGHRDHTVTAQAMKAGAIEFLPKPFRDQDMLDAVQTGIARDRARRQGASGIST